MQLLLVRHAVYAGWQPGRLLGASDPDLSAAGRTQAAALAHKLREAGTKISRCVCSPRKRARQTAEFLSAGGLSVETDPDLREVDFGRWDGLMFEEIAHAEPEAVQRWASFAPDFCFPGGEALADFIARVRAATRRLLAGPQDTVLVVSHGGVIRTMICELLGLSAAQYLLFEVKPAALTTLNVFDGKGVLAGLNEFYSEGHDLARPEDDARTTKN